MQKHLTRLRLLPKFAKSIIRNTMLRLKHTLIKYLNKTQ